MTQPQWTRREVLVGLVVGLYLLVQVAVPLVALADRGRLLFAPTNPAEWGHDRTRYSWQMFSTVPVSPTYEVLWDDGSISEVNSPAVVGRIRGRAHYAAVPDKVCNRLSSAVEIRHEGDVHSC